MFKSSTLACTSYVTSGLSVDFHRQCKLFAFLMHKLQLMRLNGSNSDCPACTHLLEAELLSDPFPNTGKSWITSVGYAHQAKLTLKSRDSIRFNWIEIQTYLKCTN